MSVFSRIKDWFTGGSSKSKSKSSTKRARAASNYGGGGSRTVRDSYGTSVKNRYRKQEDEEERRRQEAKRKQDERTNALKQMAKRTDDLSSGNKTSSVTGMQTSGSGRSRALAKLAEKSNNAPTDPKQKRLKDIQTKRTENLQKLAKKVENDRASYNKATGNKYNADTGNKEHDAKARQRIKSGEYQSDPNAEKWEVKNHPVAASAARGALSGVTFGASELVAQKSKKRKESGAEEFYQKNKNKTAETAGEIAGSLAGFGLTGGASKAAVGKVGGKAIGEKAASKLATNSRVLRAAEKELQLAIDKGAVNVTSKAMRDELVKEFAKNRASRIVGAVGEDAAINLTTGAMSDISHSILDSDSPEEFAKNMGINAAMNVGLGGLTSVAPALRTQQGVLKKRLRDETLGAISNANARETMRETFANNMPKIDVNELLSKRLEKGATDALTPVTTTSKEAIATDARRVASEANEAALLPNNMLKELDDRGEVWLGEHGHISANENGTYNLFVSGVGDRTLTRTDAEDYIKRSTDDLNQYIERTRTTRTSPLSETELTRIEEIDSEISRLRSKGKDDADELVRNRYKGIDDYNERQRELAKAERKLVQERDNIVRKEPAQAVRQPTNTQAVTPRSPSEIMQGYKSTGSQKKIADAQSRVRALVESGDTQGARAEIERAVDDIVSNARIVEPLDDTTQEIKSYLRNTPVSVSNKVDAGYLSGGFNEFRKGNFGSLRITNDGTPVDELWGELQDRYGRELFPDDIINPSDQIQYLADLAKSKGAEYQLADDEIAYLREQLSDSLWETANADREHAPFNMRDEDWQTMNAADRPIEDEELAELERQLIENGDIEPPRPNLETPIEEDASQFAQVDDGIAGIDAEADNVAERRMPQTKEEKVATRVEERATNRKMLDEDIKARRENVENAKIKEQQVKPRKMPKGEKLTASVSKNIKGATYEKATKPASAEDIIESERNYIRGQASNYENVVSRAGESLKSAVGNEAELKTIQKKIDDGSLNYARIKNKEKYEWAVRDFVDNKDTVAKKMLKYSEDIDSIPATQLVDTHYQAHAVMKMMRGQLDNPELSEAEREAARELYGAAASVTQQLSSLSGQINQFQGVMVHCDGRTRMRNAVDNIANTLDNSRGFRRSKTGKGLSGNVFQRKNQIRDLIYADPDARKALTKIIDAATEEEYGDGMQELLYATSKMNRKHALDYVQTWRYLAMLGNPKTHVRNILGNVTFSGIRQLSNTNRSVLEKHFEKYAAEHGLEIERHGKASITAFAEARTDKPTSEAGKAAKEWFEKDKDKILGISKYDENISKGSDPAFMKWLSVMSDKNGAALTAEDNFFRKRSYKESFIKSYNQYKKDGREITDELLEKIHQSALGESQVATFNEFNSMAQVLSKWSHPNYNASLGRKILGWGVNATMPFTKVPANILNQSVNYSPAGVVRGIANIRTAAATGDSKVFNKALDELSSGLTGTGIAALGFFLGKNTDWFTTNAGSEDFAAKFKKGQGVQNYSVTFKDPISGQDYSMTLDWLVPTSSTFFAGVEAANQMKRGYGDLFEYVGDISQVTSRVIEPVLETSMLSGLYNIIEGMRSTSGDDDKQSALSLTLRELAQSYMNSLVPTVQGQVARTAYKSDMQIAGDNDWQYWMNSLKNKMGLANTNALGTDALGADTTAYGDVKGKKETTEDYVKSGLKNFLSPANIQKVDLSELDKQKIKQYEDAVKNGADPQEASYLFPKKQYKKQFAVGDMDIKMSNRDLSTYNQAKTTGGAEGARIALESIIFNRYDKDSSGHRTILRDGYTAAEKQKIIKQFEGKSIREVEQWLYKQPQFKSADPMEQKRVINHLWNLSGQGKSVGAKRAGEQAVIEAQGGDVNEYNFNNEITEKKRAALQPYIDAGIITYEDAVDFARYAGKTYYYENDEGGTSQTYFNKKQMLEYLKDKGYDDETAAALFNSFKASNAKEYGSSSYRRGRRRRGYRRWHSWGGGSSAKATVPKPKKFKTSDMIMGEALTSKKSSSSSKKVTPPKLKQVERKIDLPTKTTTTSKRK